MHKYPTSFQAVDNVIIYREVGNILLARKEDERLWRFPGGFVDPSDQSLERAAVREMKEELSINCECSYPKYLFSFRVPDPRYADSDDKIMSAVFVSFYLFGRVAAQDDICETKWVSKEYLLTHFKEIIMPCHLPLVNGLIEKGLL